MVTGEGPRVRNRPVESRPAARGGSELVDVAIVGGGIAGLAAAQRLQARGDTDWLLIESSPRLGGKIVTERVEGFVVEGGADSFLAAKPWGMAMCRELGFEDQLTGTDPRYRKTYVKRDSRLHPLPAGLTGLVPSRLGPLLTSSVLRPGGRLRAACETLVPAKRSDEEESIAQFVSRRFGRETYDWLVEPLLSGIFAGDGERLSLAATFPALVEGERSGGSIVRRMLWARARSLLSMQAAQGNPQPAGFVTPRQGLGSLVDALAERLPAERIRVGARVEVLEPDQSGGWRLELSDGSRVRAAAVIVATPAHVTASLAERFSPEMASALREIPYVSTTTVSIGFDAADVPSRLDGYGYVSPRAAGGAVVACTWTSNKFPGRAPEDGFLIRFYLGRSGVDAIASADEETVRQVVRDELAEVLGIRREPRFWRVFRWPQALPQYNVGHVELMQRLERIREPLSGLFLAGAAYRGVGVPNCIDSGWSAADEAARISIAGQAPRRHVS